MKCYRCRTECAPDVDACPECGSVAFTHGLVPSWPPIVAIPHTTQDCGGKGGERDGHEHGSFAAFLLGPVPPAPNLRHFADSHRDVVMPKSRRSA